MEIKVVSGKVAVIKTQLLALPAYGKKWREPAINALDEETEGLISRLAREEGFKGSSGQALTVTGASGVLATRIAVLGLGAPNPNPAQQVLRYACRAARFATAKKLKRLAIVLPPSPVAGDFDDADLVRWVALGAELGTYGFDKHRTEKGRKVRPPATLVIVLPKERSDGKGVTKRLRGAIVEGTHTADAVRLARDLINEPGNELDPATLTSRAKAMATKAGLGVRVLGLRDIRRRKMRLLEAVGRAAETPPRLVHLTHVPKKGKPRGKIALVGKGITFDSGGLSLKPAKGMIDMKGDMGGAAVTLGALMAAVSLDLPYEIHGIVPIAENMPGANAYRPGDVVRSMSGKTVEVLNTDAEGRLILADACRRQDGGRENEGVQPVVREATAQMFL